MTRLLSRRSIDSVLRDLPVNSLNTIEERRRLCKFIGYTSVPDVRVQVWDVTPSEGETFAVEGYVSSPNTLLALKKVSENLGTECDTSRVATLPDPQLGDQIFGLVTCEECPLYATAPEGECLDTNLYGDSLVILRRGENHSLVQVPNGYIGWVPNDTFRTLNTSEWIQWMKQDRLVFVSEIKMNGITIPPGAELPLLSSNEVLLPTNETIQKPEMGAIHVTRQMNHQRKALCSMATSLNGTKYVWGGVSSKGIDCSGLTGRAYRNIGIYLPRDANQQCLMGRISAIPGVTQALEPGDLLFFSGKYGGITHVAMSLGPDQYIHAGDNGVSVITVERPEDYGERFLLRNG